jgi:hypothetical protein
VTTQPQTTAVPDLARLKRAVDAAVLATRTPPTPGAESWPITFPDEHLTQEDQALVWEVVRYIRRAERELYRKFLHERTIFSNIVNHFAQSDSDQIADLISELWDRATNENTWIVDIPLTNLTLPRETVPLGARGMLVRADPRRRTPGRFEGPYLKGVLPVRRHLGDELTPYRRWLTGSELWEQDIDTRAYASLMLVEDGIEEVALSLAESRARLALGMWCLLSPPRAQYHPSQPWPDVGRFFPAPSIEMGTQRKLYNPSRVGGQRRGAHITTYNPYRLTSSEQFQRAPFDAMDEARKGNQCALALLSAARSLYLAEAVPNDLERTERVLHVWRAKEALCSRGRRGQGDNDQRWERLVVNLRLRREMRERGYLREEIDEAFDLIRSLRDLATHRSEDVLVNLDYPDQLKTQLRKRELDANSLGLALVAADWPVLLMMVHVATRRLTKAAMKNGWDETWFHSQFERRGARRRTSRASP